MPVILGVPTSNFVPVMSGKSVAVTIIIVIMVLALVPVMPIVVIILTLTALVALVRPGGPRLFLRLGLLGFGLAVGFAFRSRSALSRFSFGFGGLFLSSGFGGFGAGIVPG